MKLSIKLIVLIFPGRKTPKEAFQDSRSEFFYFSSLPIVDGLSAAGNSKENAPPDDLETELILTDGKGQSGFESSSLDSQTTLLARNTPIGQSCDLEFQSPKLPPKAFGPRISRVFDRMDELPLLKKVPEPKECREMPVEPLFEIQMNSPVLEPRGAENRSPSLLQLLERHQSKFDGEDSENAGKFSRFHRLRKPIRRSIHAKPQALGDYNDKDRLI